MMKQRWKGLKCREKGWVYLSFIALGGLTGMLGFLMEKMWLTRLGITIIIIDFIGYLVLARCPHCNKMLWRQDGVYCQYCGRSLDKSDHKGE